MNRVLLTFLALIIIHSSFAQNTAEADATGGPQGEEEVFIMVEKQPEPKGGMKALYQFIAANLQYPQKAREEGIQGRVYVQFIVDKSGEARDIKVIKGVSHELNLEAVRVLTEFAQENSWNPGTQRGKAVHVRMVLPIVFQFSEPEKPKKNNS
jgi:periplasmic protein TonB